MRRVLCLSSLVLTVLLLAGCRPAPATPPLEYEITYRVTGMTSASITYAIGGVTEQRTNAQLPFERTFTAHRGDHLYISAQNLAPNGHVKCEILWGKASLQEATSIGGNAIATCSDSL